MSLQQDFTEIKKLFEAVAPIGRNNSTAHGKAHTPNKKHPWKHDSIYRKMPPGSDRSPGDIRGIANKLKYRNAPKDILTGGFRTREEMDHETLMTR